jgi:hypothetical protein
MKRLFNGLKYAKRGKNTCALVRGTDFTDAVVHIPESSFLYGRVTEIEDYAFRKNSCIQSVVIPEGIVAIGEGAFEGCKNLKSVSLPRSLRRIGRKAFRGCTSLCSIDIPDGVDRIESEVFLGCASLSRVNMAHVRRIDAGAFQDCMDLSEITPPELLEDVSASAFRNSSLTMRGAASEGGLYYLSGWVIGCVSGIETYTMSADTKGIASGVFADESHYIRRVNEAYTGMEQEFLAALECPNMPLPDLLSVPQFHEEIIPAFLNYQGTVEEWNRIQKPSHSIQIPVSVTAVDGEISTTL